MGTTGRTIKLNLDVLKAELARSQWTAQAIEEKICRKIPVSAATLRKWRLGQRDPFLRAACILADILELPRAALLVGYEKRPHDLRVAILPHPRSSLFIGRQADISALARTLSGPRPSPVVVTAPSGFGKTQLVNEFAHRNREKYDLAVWCNAESSEQLHASLLQFADACAPATAQTELFVRLSQITAQATSTLVVLDNLNNPHITDQLLPQIKSAHIVATGHPTTSWLPMFRPLPIGGLDIEAASELLSTVANSPDVRSAERIALQLSCSPTQLIQTGMLCRAAGKSLDQWRVVDGDIYALDSVTALADYETKKLFGWKPVLDTVSTQTSLANSLLRASLVSPDSIPSILIANSAGDAVNDLLALTSNYLASSSDEHFLYIHRSLQMAARAYFSNEHIADALRMVLGILETLAPVEVDEAESVDRYYDLAPHAVVALEHADTILMTVHPHRILTGIALVFRRQGLMDAAERLAIRALKTAPPEHAIHLHIYLCDIYKHLRKMQSGLDSGFAAERAYDALALDRPRLKAAIYNNLGNIYLRAEEAFGAEKFYVKALDIDIITGNKRGESIRKLNIAEARRLRGDFVGAIELGKQSIDAGVEGYGPSHERVARRYISLAETLLMTSDSSQAVQYIRKALMILLTCNGAHVPTVAHILNLLERTPFESTGGCIEEAHQVAERFNVPFTPHEPQKGELPQ